MADTPPAAQPTEPVPKAEPVTIEKITCGNCGSPAELEVTTVDGKRVEKVRPHPGC